MTIGEDRVRVNFNPSVLSIVDKVKRQAAELIDLCASNFNAEPHVEINGEYNRCLSLAMTAFEEGAMWAVKAFTTLEKPK